MIREMLAAIPGARSFKRRVESIPWVKRLLAASFRSDTYWERRYRAGGTSGVGSVGRLGEFKADVINQFVKEYDVRSVIEFGCGDGTQLALGAYPSYIGIDVSERAVSICRNAYRNDPSKKFMHTSNPDVDRQRGDLALSLDVIYHLVEDSVYESYMRRLFAAADRYVIVYSSNHDEIAQDRHVRHRQFSRWIVEHAPSWKLLKTIPNRFPFDSSQQGETSFANFYIFESAHS